MSKRRGVILAVVLEGRSQAEVARDFGVSAASVSRWVARYRVEGDAAFEPRSRRPHSSPTATGPEVVAAIVNLRGELAGGGLDGGPVTIRWHLQHRLGIDVSVSTIRRHLVAAGLVAPNPKKKPKSAYIRFEADLPNETWQGDFCHWRLGGGVDAEILTWLDDHSRFAVLIPLLQASAPWVDTPNTDDPLRNPVCPSRAVSRARLESGEGRALHVPIGRRGHARVAVLTVIEDEFDAALQALGADHEIGVSGVFAPEAVDGPKPQVPFVVARCAHRSNMPAQSSTARVLEDWRPEVLVLLGIGGGVMRPAVMEGGVEWEGPMPGDVVLAEYIHYAEFTKNVPAGSKLRYFPIDQPTSSLVQAHGDALRLAGQGPGAWHEQLPVARPSPGTPALHIGEIVAVEGVAGDPMNAHQKTYLERFDHAVAVDMESGGVARALHEARSDVHYNPRWMCIRVISDRVYAVAEPDHEAALPTLENNEERSEWKGYAVAVAGAFTRRVLERLLAQPREAMPADPGAAGFEGWA